MGFEALDLEVILATIKGANGKSRVSAYTLQRALLEFFTECKLFPVGIYADVPAVQSWALKYAVAIKKLVTLLSHSKFHSLFRVGVCSPSSWSHIWVVSLNQKFCPSSFV